MAIAACTLDELRDRVTCLPQGNDDMVYRKQDVSEVGLYWFIIVDPRQRYVLPL